MHHFSFAPPTYLNSQLGMHGLDRSSAPGCAAPSQATFNSTMNPDGSNTTETDGYVITTRPGNAQAGGTVTVFNKTTGKEQEHIWGDPHSSGGEFHGTMTMLLDDGTKVSVETQPYGDATLASAVTITNGHNGVRLTGVSSGALTMQQADGKRLDRSVADGMTVYSTPDGMRGQHGEVVNQQWMNTHDTQLNPWLQNEPDVELPGARSGADHPSRFQSQAPSPRMEAEIHRYLQDFLNRLQSTLGINALNLEGRFSGMPNAPHQRHCYQSSLGWSNQAANNPFMFLQAV